MGLFSKSKAKPKPEPVENYVPPEQEPEATPEPTLADVVANQAIIAENLALIYNEIKALQDMIREAAGEELEPPLPPVPEPTPEELRQAALALRQQKAAAPKSTTVSLKRK